MGNWIVDAARADVYKERMEKALLEVAKYKAGLWMCTA